MLTEGLETAHLYDEPFTLAVPAGHPLADRERVKLEDLKDETLLLLEDGHCLRDHALSVCSRIRLSEEQDYRATSLETLRQMVAAGTASRCCPNSLPPRPSHRARTQDQAVCKPAPVRTIGAVWRKSTTRGKAIDAVIAAIRTAMKEESKR